MNEDFISALDELENERGIKKEVLLDAIENALISAYKRHFGITQNARVTIDDKSGEVKVFAEKTVVDDVFDDSFEISLEDAKAINPVYELGDILEIEVTPSSFGRIAAQTAKQVVVQRIREAERGIIYEQYAGKQDELMTGVIHRQERNCYCLEMGRAEGILPFSETIRGEKYEINKRLKVYVIEIKKSPKGPQIIVSRSHPGLIKRLFEMEVPEIAQNVVQITGIAREAGQRSKIAVYSEDSNVDPIGACIGPKGSRIEKVVYELNGERIDVIPWSKEPSEFIANALRPAKVIMTQVDEDKHEARIIVPDYQLSLAIGKEGQNARLASKLTGYKIDIKSQSQIVGNVFDDEDKEKASAGLFDLPKIDYDDEEYNMSFDELVGNIPIVDNVAIEDEGAADGGDNGESEE